MVLSPKGHDGKRARRHQWSPLCPPPSPASLLHPASLPHLPQPRISALASSTSTRGPHPIQHIPPSSSNPPPGSSLPRPSCPAPPQPAGLSEQEPLHLHFSGHCLANGLLICSIVPCEANSISASQSSLPVDSVIDWRNSCHRPAACSLPLSLPVCTTPPPRPPPCAQEAAHPCHLPKDLSPAMKNDRNI